MPPAYVKDLGSANSKSSSTTLAITSTGAVPVGNCVLVAVGGLTQSTDIASCADSRGNTYTRLGGASYDLGVGRSAIFASILTTALQVGDTITATWASAVSTRVAAAIEASGITNLTLDGASPITVEAASSASMSNGPVVTTNAHDFLWAMWLVSNGTAVFDLTPTGGWTESQLATTGITGTNRSIGTQYRVVSATGSYTATATQDAARAYDGVLVALRGSPPAGAQTVAAEPIAMALALPAPGLAVHTQLAAVPAALALALPAPSITTGSRVEPPPMALALALPAPALAWDVALAPPPMALAVALPPPGITTMSYLDAVPMALVVAMPAPGLAWGSGVAAVPIDLAVALPMPTISATSGLPWYSWTGLPSVWQLQVLDRTAMAAVALVTPLGVRYTRRLNAGGEMVATLSDDQLPALLVDGAPCRLLRSGLAMAAGIVQVQTLRRDPNGVGGWEITMPDPFAANVERRYRRTAVTYTGVEQTEIMRSLVQAENVLGHTHLGVATARADRYRDRTYDPGKAVGEAIRQVAGVVEGPYFKILPLQPVAGQEVSVITWSWPEPGVHRPAAPLGSGEATVGNVTEYEMVRERPINTVLAFGAGDPPITHLAEDTALQALHGIVMATLSLTDVSDPATLANHAQAALRRQDDVALQVQLVGTSANGPRTPLLGDDFEVGDLLDVDLPEYAGQVWVTEATVEVDSDGYARTVSMALVTSPERARGYRPPTEGAQALLAEHERRLRNIEASG